MNRGLWEPFLPKGLKYMPSEWVGDFDLTWSYEVEQEDQDLYFKIYSPLVNKPETVYKNLRQMILRNLEEMQRKHIPIRADGPTKIVVHEKITIEVMKGDVINDNANIKCGTISWYLNPENGLAKSFVQVGG